MRKVKLDGKKAANLHEDKVVTILGKEVTVRNHIPYADKLALAEDVANASVLIDDESNTVMETHIRPAIDAYALLRYYTNIDTDNMTPAEAYDLITNTDIANDIKKICGQDFEKSMYITDCMIANVIDMFTHRNSLGYSIKKSFGFLLNGEDMTETFANSIGLKDEMVETFQKLREANEAEKSKVDNGKLNVGGNIIDLTPKE